MIKPDRSTTIIECGPCLLEELHLRLISCFN
jgi:hypothetical protein